MFSKMFQPKPKNMKKRLFFGLFLFVMLFTMGAWQFAAAELEQLQEEITKEEKFVESKHKGDFR